MKNIMIIVYVTTVFFKSRIGTCEKVYASLTNDSSENFYVAVSRAGMIYKLYTHMIKDNLYKKVNVSGVKQNST